MTDQAAAVGARIRALRLERNLSKGKLALAVGSSSGAQLVTSWEAGSMPNGRWLPALAAALGVTLDELMGGDNG